MLFTKREIKIELKGIEHYGNSTVQENNCDKIRKICREEWKSHEDILDEMSLLFALPNLKVTIPHPKNPEMRIRYAVGPVTIYRRWLSLHLQANADGSLKYPPRLLERVRELDLYLRVRAKVLHQ